VHLLTLAFSFFRSMVGMRCRPPTIARFMTYRAGHVRRYHGGTDWQMAACDLRRSCNRSSESVRFTHHKSPKMPLAHLVAQKHNRSA